MKRRIVSRMSREKPTVWIGKSGVTAQLISEIDKQLSKRETVKVKVLRSALTKKSVSEIATEVSKKTESSPITIRGHTFILYRPKKPL